MFLFSSTLEPPKPEHFQSSGMWKRGVGCGWTVCGAELGGKKCGLAEFRERNCRAPKTAVSLRRWSRERARSISQDNWFAKKVESELLRGYQCSSIQGDFAFLGSFSNVCRHFWSSYLGAGRDSYLWKEAKDIAKHPTMHPLPHNEELSAPNIRYF